LREKRESVAAASEAGLENRSLDRPQWRIHWRTSAESGSSKPKTPPHARPAKPFTPVRFR
jgi:hypothetical protein